MKKKICFVISSMCRGGAERVMSILVNNAAQMDNDVYLILISRPQVDYEIDSRINVIRLSDELVGVRGINANRKRREILKKHLLEINPDLVVSFLTVCNIFVSMALKNTDIPFIVSERNDPIKDCPSRMKRLLRNHYYKYAKGIVFQTEDAKKHFSKKIQARSVVIPNPVKSDLPYADVQNAKNVVVAAARLTEQKNYPMMLKAFKLFLSKHPDYELRIYGDGVLKDSLISLSQALEIESKVFFEGNISDLHERIKFAKMFVLSSDYEGISNSLLEALAMGLPSVSTDCPCGGSAMLIKDGVSGFLTPVGDEAAFCDAMDKIASSEALAKTLSKNAVTVRDTHSENVIVKRYFEYFEIYIKR